MSTLAGHTSRLLGDPHVGPEERMAIRWALQTTAQEEVEEAEQEEAKARGKVDHEKEKEEANSKAGVKEEKE
jgi:hypothetical protein